MLERHNYICLFFMKLDLILLKGNFFSKAKFHNNKYWGPLVLIPKVPWFPMYG